MSNHKNLLFFNKEGDNLNFNYSDINDRFEGNILFHENSTDTFKTAGLYMLESIPSFEYEYPGELFLNRFQLFNEFAFDFYTGDQENKKINRIEPINNDSGFYSKWIYGDDFNRIFPVGSIIKFDSPLLEFTNTLQTYTVVSSKPGAIMIISSVDNSTFESDFYAEYINEITYIEKTISSINAIGVYNYINESYKSNLSKWNEVDFYDNLYKGKKLNIINSEKNDKVYTVKETNLTDSKFFEYQTETSLLTSDLIIEVSLKTDLPRIYEGGISLEHIPGTWSVPSKNKISLTGTIPEILKPGREFKIVGSSNNQNFFTVANIPSFIGNSEITYYATHSQVLFNNKIYECIQSYTHSFASQSTLYITPENSSYWTPIITHLMLDQLVSNESISNGQVYLTTDKLYFYQSWTQSSELTLASAAEKYSTDLKSLNIELCYENKKIKSDLTYPSKYVEVTYYNGEIGPAYSITTKKEVYERLIQVEEKVSKELNYDISSNFSVNIVFTDIDEYGLKIKLGKQVYEEEVCWVYSGMSPDMERTIDKTLRSWLKRNYISLQKLGIVSDLKYTGSYNSVFYNSICLKTEYPNVDLYINEILVGSTANYYVEHSTILFNDMGGYLSIFINNDTYDQTSVINQDGTVNISSTLEKWVIEHSQYLSTYGILVSNINNLLKFDTKHPNRRLEYEVKIGKISLPGIESYKIINKIKGNKGALIASNEVKLSESATGTYSFEDAGFATGMAFSINNTFHTWNNTEFNVQFLDPSVMNLSYQGPFWGTTSSICNKSGLVTLAFDIGFGQTICDGNGGSISGENGPFNQNQFSSAFGIKYNPNDYTINNYDISNEPNSTNLVDINYIQLTNSIYVLGNGLIVVDAYSGIKTNSIDLSSNTDSQFMRFNSINNYLYCVSKQKIFVIEPLLNTVIETWAYINKIKDVCINTSNGDIYISFDDVAEIEVRNSSNTISATITSTSTNFPIDATSMGKMVFNSFESDMYVITNSPTEGVIRIDGSSRTIQSSYGISGATGSILYEPINESIYVFGDTWLYKIDNNLITQTSVEYSSFSEMIFNNLSGSINISNSSNSIKSMDIDSDQLLFNSYSSSYGYLSLNQYDGCIYISSQSNNKISIIDSNSGSTLQNIPLNSMSGNIVYNPERKSIWTIQPGIKKIVEIEVTLNLEILPINGLEISEDNQYGTLHKDYKPHDSVWLKTKEYLRRPRENFQNEVEVNYYWKWQSDNTPEFFLYDFTGNQLTMSGSYSYTGSKPLTTPILNRKPNKEIDKCSKSEYQQTIFDEIKYKLSYIDDSEDISSSPEPLELFIGFKSEEEGPLRSVLQLYKREDISLTYESTSTNDTIITFETTDINGPDKRGIIKINTDSQENFLEKGLKNGQLISIFIKDISNIKNQYISNNNGLVFRIRSVFYKTIILDFINVEDDILFTESTAIPDYPKTGLKTYCRLNINVIDREIGRFNTLGQTEIEDIRFKTELGNIGKLIAPNEVFIFKDYDILEGGTDWKYLNKKRKEMLMMKHLIYPYVGAYKSIINAINFFGYNDLKLNEYYRNINPQSEKFLKLFKVEVPDIFDNTVEGWTESEFIKNNFPNDDYEETNMFNLSYDITDKDGNKIINYSLDEIIIKLQGLKYWLKRNIIPLTHKILDITGQSYFRQQNQITHTSYDTKIVNIMQNMTPISFKMNEAYLIPINSGSTVYNCVIDFYTINKNINSLTKPSNTHKIDLPDYFNLTIRTYKTYKEWSPFTVYKIGDKVIYYGRIYESQINNNKVKNPRKYENVKSWTSNSNYETTSTVEYNRDIFVFNGTTSSSNPIVATQSWLKITEWKEVDLEPVQTIKEFRQIEKEMDNPIPPFNFTIDSNIDPFIVIEVTSDNGYGLIYRDKKNYEVRGNKDLVEPINYVDLIGPFTPITPIY